MQRTEYTLRNDTGQRSYRGAYTNQYGQVSR